MDEKYASIKKECLKSTEKDPIELIFHIMQKDYINIHGPEHHVLDGSCFLTALHNAGVEFDLEKALDEMIERGGKMPGATCGQWGVCGSAASVGAALALRKISDAGGPRCCKRNAFLSLQTAVDFVKVQYGVELPAKDIACIFSDRNKQCLGSACPFFAG